jgi:hypothetical protein
MNTAAHDWILRVIGAIDNYNMTDKTDDLAPMIADLIRDTPRELINDVMRDISRYAIAKQQEYTKQRALELLIADSDADDWHCSSRISTPPPLPADSDDAEAKEERSDEREERSDEREECSDEEADDEKEATEEQSDEAEIQDAYNEMHDMIRNLEPSAVMLEHLEEWPEIAYEMDKWEYMLLHHLIVKCAPLSVIQAVMKENPDALTFEVGNEGYVPLQLAVRHGRSLEVIQAIYKANPQMIQKVSHWGNTAHSLACKYQRDVSIKVFLYTYRDAAPLLDEDDDDDMPGLIPITPPPEKDFLTEFVRSVGMREAYPVLVILLAWITMLTLSLLAGVRMLV